MIASLGSILALPLALIGVAIKWIHLGLTIDQLAHKGSAVGYHIPMVLEMFSRLGDRTVAYLNTKYIAEKSNLPVYFLPFKGCENFQFSQEETLTEPRYFKNVVYLNTAEEIEKLKEAKKDDSTLYLLSYFPHARNLEEESPDCKYVKYTTDWVSFGPRVGELLKVIKPHTLIDIPKDSYSIALHIRDGGDFDAEKTKTLHPLKLPPMNFYLGELERVLTSNLLPSGAPVFIHIFTDALEPKKVHDKVQASLSGLNLEGREVELSYNEHASLTDDIANMSRFQCMIRADSNLSAPIATGSKALELEIFPTHVKMDAACENISITKVKIVSNRKQIGTPETDYSKKIVTEGLPILFFKKFHDYYGVLTT